jgi:hypothetical protein
VAASERSEEWDVRRVRQWWNLWFADDSISLHLFPIPSPECIRKSRQTHLLPTSILSLLNLTTIYIT